MPTHSPDYVEAMTSPQAPRGRLSQNPQLSASERDRLEMYEEALYDLEIRGFKQASVLRFCPWDQTLDGVAHNLKKIPGVPIDGEIWRTHQPRVELRNGLSIPFVHHVITAPYVSVGTRFRGRSESDSTAETKASISLPLELARDIVGQQNQFRSQGGVVCYDSNELPGKLLHGPTAGWVNHKEQMPLVDAIEAAVSRMLIHMNELVNQAEQAYMSDDKNLKREVRGNRFRVAVQYLLNAGQIQHEPQWFTERSEGSKVKSIDCPMCLKRVAAGAVQCEACKYIIDPVKGYGHLYTEESPGGMMTARRMTQLQLKELGLYPRIKPHAEWLEDQNRATEEEGKKRKKAE